MEKIRLKDGTEYDLVNNSTENVYLISLNGMSATDIISALSEINLSQFSIIGEDGLEMAIYKDKELALPAPINRDGDDYILTVYLKDVDLVKKSINQISKQLSTAQSEISHLNGEVDSLSNTIVIISMQNLI